MKAMIMAAGRGERMRPLTDMTPKPLLCANNKPLIEYHIEALVNAGIKDIVVNVAWLSEQLIQYLGDGSQFNANISVSVEQEALETGGGIVKALPILGQEPFIVINGDVFCDYDYHDLSQLDMRNKLAHLVMVPNPDHNPEGDFGIRHNMATIEGPKYTFSGVRIFSPALFKGCVIERFSVVPRLKEAIKQNKVSAELHEKIWLDVGTPQRLEKLQNDLLLTRSNLR